MGPNEILKFLHSKGNHKKKIKRQPVEWENIFADDETDKELISNIYSLYSSI